jgi:hypothetical protein
MSKSRHAIIGAAIMVVLAATVIGCLAALAPGALGVTEVKAEPQSITEGPSTVFKGGACSLLAWPNYEQSCQFDARQLAGEVRTVRIIAVR